MASICMDETRMNNLNELFQQYYHQTPDFISISPGRVNLIGEHIDYSDFGVLPMAIQHSSMIAFAVVEGDKEEEGLGRTIVMKNKDNQRFKEGEVTISPVEGETFGVQFDRNNKTWHQFFLAGYVGVVQQFVKELGEGVAKEVKDRLVYGQKSEKWCILVEGNVPVGSGLSSSSAFVCASSVMSMHALRTLSLCPPTWKGLSKLALGPITAKCERYVGAESGGMDQAISLLGQQGLAKLIQFNPLAAFDVCLPSCSSFVLASSLKEHSVGDSQYNVRVVECRLVVNLLAKELEKRGLLPSSSSCSSSSPPPSRWETMRQLAIYLGKNNEEGLKEMGGYVSKFLKEGGYTLKEAGEGLGMTREEVVKGFVPEHVVGRVEEVEGGEGLMLKKRGRHVFLEAARVLEFKRVCGECGGEGGRTEEEGMERLGELMGESHESCRDDYDCSCEELNKLVEKSKQLGAVGARLTGAGWGGWGVVLIKEEQKDEFLEGLRKYFLECGVGEGEVDKNYAWTRPSEGARLWEVEEGKWVELE